MTEDLLMDTIKTKRHVGYAYEKLCEAVDEFGEKWEKKGVIFSANVDWKSKTNLWININDKLPDSIQEIIEDFQETFNVELTEIVEKRLLKTSMRDFSSINWIYSFQHVDKWKDLGLIEEEWSQQK